MKIYWVVFLALLAAVQGGVVPAKVEPAKVEPAIVGGSDAYLGQFPWHAFITMEQSAFCGGAAISEKWVLTAGHCVDSFERFTLTFGRLLPGNVVSGGGVQSSQAQVHVIHELYDPQRITNNIGLIQLETPLVWTTSVQAVELPTFSQVGSSFAGLDATVSGWGKTFYGATDFADTLQWVDLPVITNNLCNTTYQAILPSNICASGLNGRSTCIGDSGSPLVLRKQTGGYSPLIGILSYDYLDCELGLPAVFTRVTSYLDWIQTNTGVIIENI